MDIGQFVLGSVLAAFSELSHSSNLTTPPVFLNDPICQHLPQLSTRVFEMSANNLPATEIACDKCGNQIAVPHFSKQELDDPFFRRIKAILYLFAGIMVIFTPWLLLGFNAYAMIVLKTQVPLYDSVLYFCGACILGILGLAPWALDLMKRISINGK